MAEAASPAPVWALTTGEAGAAGQAEGLAAAVGRPYEVKTVRLLRPWSWLPAHRQAPGLLQYGLADRIEPPWPELLITCGRRSASVSIAVRRAAGGRCFTVHIQNPRVPLHHFDLVVPPRHDGVSGPNVVATRAALHRLTPEALAAASEAWRSRFGDLNVAVLLGGRSRSHRFTPETLEALADGLSRLKGPVAVTASRRTEPAVIAELKARLPGAWFWDGTGCNPYPGMLALARHIVVTEDSVSMTSEAVSTGKPVYAARMAGGNRRLARFQTALREEGILRPFEGRLAEWQYEPVNEVPRVAAELLRRMEARSLQAERLRGE